MQFGPQHYVASLRTKQGEFDAVESLAPSARARFTPLWEVNPSDATEDGDDPSASAEPVISRLPTLIHNASNGLQGFVDWSLVSQSRRMANGDHPLDWLCRSTAALGTVLIPVVRTDSDTGTLGAARSAGEAALRLDFDDLSDPNSAANLRGTLTTAGMDIATTHLIVDCEHLTRQLASVLQQLLPTLLAPVLALGPWRTFTLLVGSLPADYSGLGPGTVVLQRLEWTLHQALCSPGLMQRQPTFGDYGIAHPVYRFMPWYYIGAAKIRYTGPSTFSVFIGRSLKTPRYGGYAQFHALASHVVSDPIYRGSAFSAGDRTISDCAAQLVGTGNGLTWVRAGTSQHITYVASVV